MEVKTTIAIPARGSSVDSAYEELNEALDGMEGLKC